MFSIDLHAHTRFFHGFRTVGDLYDPLGVRALRAMAGVRDLDGVALTNHDYYTEFDLPKTTDGDRVATIPGIEVTTCDGHVVVVGPNPPRETEPGVLTPAELVDIAHDRGCAAIIAHPYRDSAVRESEADFDAIEINGKHPRTWERVRALAEARDLPLVGGSDTHYPVEIGRAYTEIDARKLTPESVVDAIRDGRVKPKVHRGPVTRTIHRMYKYVHDQKGYIGEEPPGPIETDEDD